VAKPCLPEADEIGLLSGSSLPLLVESPASSALKNLYGFWANAVAFAAVNQGVSSLTLFDDFKRVQAGKPILLRPEALFGQEQRTGIALDSTPRRVRKGHLYSSTHVRIVAGVRLLVGLSADVVPSYLDPEGILQLGGEQRLVHYKHRQKLVPLPAPMTGWAMALSPIEFGSLRMIGLLDRPRASGTLLRMAGWDMKNQFHKPTLAFLPMGTVIEIGDISSGLPFGFIAI
jgi:CRISPR-associated protein Cmr3